MAVKTGFRFPRKFGFGVSAGDIPVRGHVRRKAKGGFVPHGKEAHQAVVRSMVDKKCLKPVKMAKGGLLPGDTEAAGQAAVEVLRKAAMPDMPTPSEQSLVKTRPMPAAPPPPMPMPAPVGPMMNKRMGPVPPMANMGNPLIKPRM